MGELYPLLMVPHFDPRPWGAKSLAPIYPEYRVQDPIGEVWLTWDHCKVANGPLRGIKLGELCQRFGRALVGETARETERFPLLIKFLFPRDKLSVQVHPDDEGARRVNEPCGKTECWYVLAAEKGAQIGLGLKSGATREHLRRAIEEIRADEILHWITVKPGEMYYVEAGTVHAIGPGSILVETQQNSDTTYRIYDYGRPRELHLEKAFQVLKEETRAGRVTGTAGSELIASPSFRVDKFHAREIFAGSTGEKGGRHSAHSLIALEGCGVVEVQGSDPVTFTKGEAVVIPASLGSYSVRPQWELEFLRMNVPGGDVPVPTTTR